MGQFLQVNGDYNIKTAEGAKIILDTGPAISGGSVVITGDLVVEGTTISVEATNLNINDNIITLNDGETGEGVTLTYSGIEIDRGFFTDSSQVPVSVFLYQEPDDIVTPTTRPTWLLANGAAPGPFNFDESNLKLRRILTDAATDEGDLILIGTGTGVVKVIGTSNYEDQVTHDDDIPNKKYVDDAIQNQPTFQIVAPQTEDTKVVIADADVTPRIAAQPGTPEYFTATTLYTTNGLSAVSVIVDGVLSTQFYDDKVLFGRPGNYGFEVDAINYEIRTEASITDQNIFIKTAGSGKLQTNKAIQIDKVGANPTYVTNSTLLFAKTADIGQSGVWFVNDLPEDSKKAGELISKNKALVFSMLF